MKKQFNFKIWAVAIALAVFTCYSCDDLEQYEPLGSNSIADATPPTAGFSVSQGAGPDDEWKDYFFGNTSTSATSYSWDFGNGTTSTDVDGSATYPGEGMFTVSLTATDGNGVTNTYTETIEIIEPEEPDVPDPTLVNADFDKLAKLGSSSLCSCSGWDNDDIGEQGESSSGNGGSDNVVKFDNNEPDHVYQEFAVTPGADYSIAIVTSHKTLASTPGPYPGSSLEIRVLAGEGYISGYAPTYYETAPEFPNSGYGYTTVAQVEDGANNLLIETLDNPDNDDYVTHTFTFNAGTNDSVALFIRGIGGDSAAGSYGYTSGDEEIRADSVTITAIN